MSLSKEYEQRVHQAINLANSHQELKLLVNKLRHRLIINKCRSEMDLPVSDEETHKQLLEVIDVFDNYFKDLKSNIDKVRNLIDPNA